MPRPKRSGTDIRKELEAAVPEAPDAYAELRNELNDTAGRVLILQQRLEELEAIVARLRLYSPI